MAERNIYPVTHRMGVSKSPPHHEALRCATLSNVVSIRAIPSMLRTLHGFQGRRNGLSRGKLDTDRRQGRAGLEARTALTRSRVAAGRWPGREGAWREAV